MRRALRPLKPDYVGGLIDRGRLYHILDRWQQVRAIAIHAPAGYGKTSLVSRWLDVAAVESAVLWLGLDDRDADPQHFLSHLARAVDPLLPGTAARIQSVLEDRPGDLEHARAHFSALLADAAGTVPMLFVLDDLHLANTPANNRFLLSLLEHGPEALHFILLARWRTGLNLSRLVAHEAVLTLDAGDLRFRPAEIYAYVLNRGFAPPTEDELAELTARSEGWITALQLSVLAVKQPGEIAALLQMLQGDRDWLATFLAEEVLNRQTPTQRAFLLQTSILNAFNADLCAAVTGDDSAYGRLSEIARADLFLIQIHDKPGWFRYHHLFQELLQHQLHAQMDLTAVAALHRKAAAWLAAEKHISTAVNHLLTAGAEDEAADLVATHVRARLVDDPYAARGLAALLPGSLIRRRPQLMLDRCFLAVAADDHRMGDCLADLTEVIDAERAAGRLQPELEAGWLVLQAAVAFRRGESDTLRIAVEEANHRVDLLPPHLAGVLAFLGYHLQRRRGRHEAATQSAATARNAFARIGFDLGVIAVQREQAFWSMRSGNPRRALEQFAEIVKACDSQRHGVLRELAQVHLNAADTLYLCNQPSAARAELATVEALAEQLQLEELSRYRDLLLTLCDMAEGDGSTTCAVVGLHATDLQSVIRHMTFVEWATRCLTQLGRGEEAWQLIQAAGLAEAGDMAEHQLRKLIPYLRAYLTRGKDVGAVGGLIDNALVEARETGERLIQLQLATFAAWQALQLDSEEQMEKRLKQAIRLAQETGYARVLLDIPALAGKVPELETPTLRPTQTPPRTAAPQVELTEQERRVLALLATEHTYQEIADKLVISINTVRTHARHLYRKLGVKRRDQAIVAARRHGLLSAQGSLFTTAG